MSKKSSDHLYQLIHSLTKNEKGYFKKYSGRYTINGQNTYLQLFDILNKQKKYDERPIIEVFKREGKTKHFSALKNYLFKLILESLRIFHSGSIVDVEVNNLVHEAELLFTKGFFKIAKTYFKKAKVLAYDVDYFPGVLWILGREIYFFSQVNQIAKKELEILITERKNVIKIISSVEKYSSMSELLSCEFGKVGRTDAKLISIANETITKLQSEKSNILNNFTSKYLYYDILDLCYNILANDSKVYEYALKKVQLFRNYPDILKEEKWRKILFVLLGNNANSESGLKKYKNMEQTIKEMELMANSNISSSNIIRAKVFETIHSMKLQFFIRTGEVKKGLILIDAMQKEYEANEKYLSSFNKMRLSYFSTVTFFIAHKFDEALFWLQKFSDYKKENVRHYHQLMERILQILIHIELGNNILAESLLRSADRLFKQKSDAPLSLKIIRDYLSKLVIDHNKKNLEKIHLNAKKQLMEKMTNRKEKEFLDNILVLPYINYRLNPTSIEQEITKYFK